MIQIHRSLGIAIGVSLTLMAIGSNAAADPTAAETGDGMIVYIGTAAGSKSRGIYMTRMDRKTGALGPAQLAVEAKNPNFLAFHPNHAFLYACAEIPDPAGGGGKGGIGGVAGFSIDHASGKLTPLNQQPSGGRGPCYVAVDRAGRNLLVANYGSGSIACVPIANDGTLREPSAVIQHEGGSGVVPKRQEGPHAHWINTDPTNRFVLASDLGLDKMFIYRFDPAKGSLEPNEPAHGTLAPGAGPRHLAWHPNGTIAYVINEMGNTVTAFHYDPSRGALNEFQTVPTLPAGYTNPDNTTAEVVVHPGGRFLYGSNRGHDSIARFAIDDSGKLAPLGHTPTQGQVPRNFAIDPSGQFLLAGNQKTGTIVVFRIDQNTGELTPTGSKIETPTPICIRFLSPPIFK